MRILIAGLGSIGSLLAVYLSPFHKIYAVGRPWHIQAIKERGYLLGKIIFQKKEVKAKLEGVSDNFAAFGNRIFDIIFITVKAYDTEKVIDDMIRNNIAGKSYILLQNGLGNEEIAIQFLKNKNIIRGITNNGANIPEPGTVVHAGLGETFLGKVSGAETDYWLDTVSKILNTVGLPTRVVSDLKPYLFRKVLINATINPLTALLKIRNIGIYENQFIREILHNITYEIVEVAKAYGIEIENAEETVLSVAKATGNNLSSMLQDILRGKRTEIDFINGKIIELAQKKNIDVPANKLIYLLIKALENIENYKV